MLKQLVIGRDGDLRLIWRAILYYVAGTYVIFPAVGRVLAFITAPMHLKPGLAPGNLAAGEFDNILTAGICTGVFALYERRRIDSYGLPFGEAFGRQTMQGVTAGILMAGSVALGMIALGGMRIDGLALKGGAMIFSAAAWLFATACAGFAEEFWFRSYLQQTLWKNIGFWPASAAIALVFAAEHYFEKQGENMRDVISLVALSMLLSYSMLRTRTLWFAVGFHSAFNFMQLFVIGTPNGARFPEGRLLAARFTGPAWLTGGVLGTEASFLMYPAIALLWCWVWWRYRRVPPLQC